MGPRETIFKRVFGTDSPSQGEPISIAKEGDNRFSIAASICLLVHRIVQLSICCCSHNWTVGQIEGGQMDGHFHYLLALWSMMMYSGAKHL